MVEVIIRPYKDKSDLDNITAIMKEAWEYYLQNPDEERLRELLEYYLMDETKKFFLAFEQDRLVGVAETTLVESFRYRGEEGRLDLIYVRDSASNYYDVHSSLMNAILEYMREEKIDFVRVDTTLENADVLYV